MERMSEGELGVLEWMAREKWGDGQRMVEEKWGARLRDGRVGSVASE